MHIYVSHSTGFDFRTELYAILKHSKLGQDHHLILPHEASDFLYNTKELFAKKECDIVLAEVSYPSTGQGIELGWANMLGIRIVCISKKGAKVSSSLQTVTREFLEYEDSDDMLEKVKAVL
jgi:nucleoside 2-deoxyribosyltransferase